MKRILKWTVVAAALAVSSYLGYGLWLGHSRASGYERVERGDPEERVIGLLGRPDRTTGRPENVSWDEADIRTNAGECVRECWYADPITICGEEWTVGFDTRGRVVSKYHYVSP